MKIPFVDLKQQYISLKTEIDETISDALLNSHFIGGEYVSTFENNFAKKYNIKNCIGVGNGTDSLYIIMKMLGIGAGDEVITVANSWISTSETITQTGAKVVFADIEPDFYTINTDDLLKKITSKTKAIIPVHIYGQMCKIDTICEIAKQHNLYVIEDCAQSHFSSYNNIYAGQFGIAASFSFYPGKNLGAYGDAGCIITNNDELATKCRMFSHHGALKKHEHKIEGINSRLDSIQAAVLNIKLKYILDWTKKRQEVAKYYNENLKSINEVTIPKIRENSEHTFHVYAIESENRGELKMHLENNGVSTAIHYPTPLPLLEAYKYLHHTPNDFPIVSSITNKLLSLPIYPELTIEQQDYIINLIKIFYSK
jgi:dTDP-4-amino-4,6-dideoxygalactose transaminase